MNANVTEKTKYFYYKVLFLKLVFRDENHLYANGLFYILTNYSKFFLFQFLGGGINMYIAILSGAPHGCISRRKKSHFLLKTFFKRLFPKLTSLSFQLVVLYLDC